jgi:hypothetical protein
MAATGRQLKVSVKVFHSLMLYLRLPVVRVREVGRERGSLTLVIEAVDAIDRGTLVVATEDEEVLGVLDLVSEEQADGLKRLLSTIDIVPTGESAYRDRDWRGAH